MAKGFGATRLKNNPYTDHGGESYRTARETYRMQSREGPIRPVHGVTEACRKRDPLSLTTITQRHTNPDDHMYKHAIVRAQPSPVKREQLPCRPKKPDIRSRSHAHGASPLSHVLYSSVLRHRAASNQATRDTCRPATRLWVRPMSAAFPSVSLGLAGHMRRALGQWAVASTPSLWPRRAFTRLPLQSTVGKRGSMAASRGVE